MKNNICNYIRIDSQSTCYGSQTSNETRMSSDPPFFFSFWYFIIHPLSATTFTTFLGPWKSCWPRHCVCGTDGLCCSSLKTLPWLAIDVRIMVKAFYLVLCYLASFCLLAKSPKLSGLKTQQTKTIIYYFLYFELAREYLG